MNLRRLRLRDDMISFNPADICTTANRGGGAAVALTDHFPVLASAFNTLLYSRDSILLSLFLSFCIARNTALDHQFGHAAAISIQTPLPSIYRADCDVKGWNLNSACCCAVLMVFWDCLWISQSKSDKTVFALRRSPSVPVWSSH